MLISAGLPDADYVLVLSSSKCSFEVNQSPLDSVFYRGALFLCLKPIMPTKTVHFGLLNGLKREFLGGFLV